MPPHGFPYVILSCVLDTLRRFRSPERAEVVGVVPIRVRKTAGRCITPPAVPAPCGRGGVAPPARPSVGDAAHGDQQPARDVRPPSPHQDGPTAPGPPPSAPGPAAPAPDHTGRMRWRPPCRDAGCPPARPAPAVPASQDTTVRPRPPPPRGSASRRALAMVLRPARWRLGDREHGAD